MRNTVVLVCLALRAAAAPAIAGAQSTASAGEWTTYGHDAGGTRFSPLDQIDTATVARLKLAWVYRTGDLLRSNGRFEATPLLIDGALYVSTPLGRVSALDPATGAERWTYDLRVDLARDYGDLANRGVSTWLDPRATRGRGMRATDLRRDHRRAADRARRRDGNAVWRLRYGRHGRPRVRPAQPSGLRGRVRGHLATRRRRRPRDRGLLDRRQQPH